MGDIAQGQQVSKKLPAKQLIPYVLLVVGAVAMAVSFFLPFASAKGDYAEYLKQYGDRVYTAEAGLHNKDVVGLSLLTFLRIYIAGLQSGKLLGYMYMEAVICITLMAVIAVSSLLILLFGVLKKPIAAIVFSVLAVVAFYALRWILTIVAYCLPRSMDTESLSISIRFRLSWLSPGRFGSWSAVTSRRPCTNNWPTTLLTALLLTALLWRTVRRSQNLSRPQRPSNSCRRVSRGGHTSSTTDWGGNPRRFPPQFVISQYHCHAAKYSTPASKIGWYLSPGTLTYKPLPERSE